jgi:two-component system alkaline phosphatase synthesis response regulator PhoP
MMPERKVVVIEDEIDILKVIEYNLRREGFQVHGVRNGEEGLATVRTVNPDLVLLDLMLPGRDGLDVCRALKDDPLTRKTPIIMVTAKGEESDVVLGLGLGADDYITKPFGIKELIARIRAVLRRADTADKDSDGRPINRGPIEIDPLRHQVRLQGTPVDFTPTEFRLLMVLAAHPGRVFTRDQLLNRAMSPEAAVVDRNVDVHIRAIRKRLSACPALIETVRGIGYRFSENYR